MLDSIMPYFESLFAVLVSRVFHNLCNGKI